jgi:hypothetical protein
VRHILTDLGVDEHVWLIATTTHGSWIPIVRVWIAQRNIGHTTLSELPITGEGNGDWRCMRSAARSRTTPPPPGGGFTVSHRRLTPRPLSASDNAFSKKYRFQKRDDGWLV